jgi:hypothetical protein
LGLSVGEIRPQGQERGHQEYSVAADFSLHHFSIGSPPEAGVSARTAALCPSLDKGTDGAVIP